MSCKTDSFAVTVVRIRSINYNVCSSLYVHYTNKRACLIKLSVSL